ncbi:hypothetical protein ACIQUQ_11265 [Streptomyces sp. NPDC101118]|uniref:hypothetical protein n=1 Tax=Streptomyces sp. NPDC101118 TaxID=3366109 RepID=UPI003800AF5A
MSSTTGTRWRTVRAAATALAAAALLAGCGTAGGGGGNGGGGGAGPQAVVPDGWGTLRTPTVSVAYPKGPDGYREEAAKDGPTAVRERSGHKESVISIRMNFTNADSVEEAAIGAEAGIQLGSTLQGTRDIDLAGTGAAKRIDFEFTATGAPGGPPKGTRVAGLILTGLDSKGQSFAVRVDTVKAARSGSELAAVIKSVEVR